MRPTVSGSQLNWAFCRSNTQQTSHPPDSSLHQSAPTDHQQQDPLPFPKPANQSSLELRPSVLGVGLTLQLQALLPSSTSWLPSVSPP